MPVDQLNALKDVIQFLLYPAPRIHSFSRPLQWNPFQRYGQFPDLKETFVFMNIYVGNLSYNITEEDLRAMFAEYGDVSSTKLIIDRDSGRSKGFGFVEMSTEDAGQKAIDELNGRDVSGRSLTVNKARPREERPRGGGGGGRGGYGGGGGGNRY